MTASPESLRKLRHDLANPLAAVLAEAQLQLLDEDKLSQEVAEAFREIERNSRRMRDILHTIGQ